MYTLSIHSPVLGRIHNILFYDISGYNAAKLYNDKNSAHN